MKRKVIFKKLPLATAHVKGKILLFSKIKEDTVRLCFNTSSDGLTFSKRSTYIHIFNSKRKEIPADRVVSISFFSPPAGHPHMTLELIGPVGRTEWYHAHSKDLKAWTVDDCLPASFGASFGKKVIFTPKETARSKNAVYYAEKGIWTKIGSTKKGFSAGHLIASPRLDRFDSDSLTVIGVIPLDHLPVGFQNDLRSYVYAEGLLVLYQSESFSETSVHISVGGLFCSSKEKDTVLWRSEAPVWHGQFGKKSSLSTPLTPLGAEPLK